MARRLSVEADEGGGNELDVCVMFDSGSGRYAREHNEEDANE
jgi:hypothetical protein